MSALELVADLFLVLGIGLAIAAAAVVNVALGLAVGATFALAIGAALTALALKRPRKPAGVVDRGPFEADA